MRKYPPCLLMKGKCVATMTRFAVTRPPSVTAVVPTIFSSLIAERLLAEGDAVYCVDGAGYDDPIIPLLCEKTKINIIAGVSYMASALSQIGLCATSTYAIPASELIAYSHLELPTSAIAVTELDDPFIAGEVKLRLLDMAGEMAGYLVDERGVTPCDVVDIDRQPSYSYATCFVLPYTHWLHKKRWTYEDLVRIVFRLREPDGCDWDKVQTHESIRNNAIEEAYELVDAIDQEDIDHILEESGDVLLQSTFHAVIAEGTGEFTVQDAVSSICHKLITRHPHVFGDVQAHDVDSALASWDQAKATEKHYESFSDRMSKVSPMPALMRAKKIQKIASKAHFDWDDALVAEEKIPEELAELNQAVSPDEREEEGGDLLFAVVNVLRLMGVEPETALLRSTRKFEARFARVERAVLDAGKQMTDCTLEELESIYQQVKNIPHD